LYLLNFQESKGMAHTIPFSNLEMRYICNATKVTG
jgi:hypothetical protein